VAGNAGVVVWNLHLRRIQNGSTKGSTRVTLGRCCEIKFPRPATHVYDLAFHPDGNNVVFLAGDGRLFSCNINEGSQPKVLPICSAIQMKALHFDAAGNFLTFSNLDGTLGVWDWRKGAVSKQTKQKVFQTALAADRWLASTSPERKVVIYDLVAGKEVLALPPEGSDVWGLAWSPDHRRLAVGMVDGNLAIWDLKEVRARLAEFEIKNPFAP
jgi:WD40 repeat protein